MDTDPVHLEYSIDPRELKRIFRNCANQHRLKMVFERGSNAEIHVHVHQESGDVMGNRYADNSSGATGAKAFGSEARATSRGDIVQGATFASADGDVLSGLFDHLLELLAEARPADAASFENATASIRQAKGEAEGTRKRSTIGSCWNKAKAWIDGALLFGAFAGETADKIKTIIEKVQAFLA